VKIKGIITGPYTLARYSVNRFYDNVEELAYAYADGLNQEARALDGVVDYVQLDEPEFSVEYPEYASELINVVFDGVGKPRMLHSCGDVSSVFHKLVELEVDVLLHEFAANPQLLDTVGQTDFKQKLGYGCVRSDTDKVETVDEISARMEKALKAFDEEKILMNPDCGLRNLPPEAAYRKLKNMVEARDRISNG
jgi:5-methyltetrahydropteroyltriglutamate--homocysteine methyltransferase